MNTEALQKAFLGRTIYRTAFSKKTLREKTLEKYFPITDVRKTGTQYTIYAVEDKERDVIGETYCSDGQTQSLLKYGFAPDGETDNDLFYLIIK